MKKLIGGALAASVLSTLCCIPVFLFVVFGVSIGSLGFLSSLEFMRIPMAILAFACFLYAFYLKIKKQIFCNCVIEDIFKTYILFVFLLLMIVLFLFYPEILPIFMDDK
ncbi:MAG: hypothetical protein RL154_437 [Pseudomonadota bacterium]|jgi:mercuric ion transport protein